MHFIAFVRFLWALPLTLAGLLVALLCNCRYVAIFNDALIFTPRKGGPVRWFFQKSGMAAFTWGQVILWDGVYRAGHHRLMTHEYVHTEQAKAWGLLLPFAYAVAAIIAWRKGGSPYHDNHFEAQARRGEMQVGWERLP